MNKLPVELGKEYIFKINDITSNGEGVAKIDNFTIFINKAIPGDEVLAKIDKLKKTYATATIIKILKYSDSRRSKTFCQFSDKCGGCPYASINYEKQLEIKENLVKDALERIGGFKDLHILPILGSNEFNYRNKAQIKVRDNQLGFYEKRSHNLIPINNCHIQSKSANSLITKIEELIKKFKIPSYNEDTHKGILRDVLIRTNKNNESNIIFVINSDRLPKSSEIVNILKEDTSIVGIYININKQKSNAILGKKTNELFKRKDLVETIGNRKYRISPTSFFQVNSDQTKVLYDVVKKFADLQQDDTLLDLYCGTGTIGLYVSDEETPLVGIEINEDAIADAVYNAELNNFSNYKFYAGKAEELISNLSLKPQCVILDPPRKGCNESLLTYLLERTIPRIVYISCNPATLARDLKILSKNYQIKAIQPVDLFPQTGHVETVALLDLK